MRLLSLSLALWIVSACSPYLHNTPQLLSQSEPESSSGQPASNVQSVRSKDFMIVAGHPLAAAEGNQILAQGGSAVDAVIAAALVLNVVEPQSSGLGGSGFLLVYDKTSGSITSYDGRETAPARARADDFWDSDGQPLPFDQASTGGRAVGVPGVLDMLKNAHQAHGHQAWSNLFTGAITLAEQGFAISPRLHQSLRKKADILQQLSPHWPLITDGVPAIGQVIDQPQLATSLRILASQGIRPFYSGQIAEKIVQAVATTNNAPGHLSLADLRSYHSHQRPALCRPYRDFKICGAPPPTSGGVTLLEILSILNHFDLSSMKLDTPEHIALITAIQQRAYHDRGLFLADPQMMTKSSQDLLDPGYISKLANTIGHDLHADRTAPPSSVSTTHISVVDAQGNAAALTASVGPSFGARLTAAGFILNGEMTDFDYRPTAQGPNRFNPGNRPLSSMSPTLVFDNHGHLRLVLGSPGGTNIIAYVARVIIAMIDHGLPVDQAVSLPHYANRRGTIEFEQGFFTDQAKALELRGHKVSWRPMTSGMNAIAIETDGTLNGAADPRREGIALGIVAKTSP